MGWKPYTAQLLPPTGRVRPAARSVLAVAALAGLGWPTGSALAQAAGSEPVDVAGSRPLPGYEPIAIRIGSAMLRPTLGVSPDFSSNVFAAGADARSDLSVTVTPGLTASLTEPGRSVSLHGDARLRRYAELGSQDDEQYRIEASGAADLPQGFGFSADVGWEDRTAARGTVANDLTIGEPLKMRELRSRIGITKDFNRLYTGVSLSAARFAYEDVDLGGGTILDQSFRDSHRWGAVANAGYEVSPRLAVEGRATFDSYDYADPDPATNRDATAYSLGAGLRYQITQLFTAQINAGYRRHRFDNPLFSDISGLALSGRLRWYPTRLVSIRGDITQSTTTSVLDQVSAVTVTDVRLGVDYEFRRNILLTGEAGLAFEDYGQIDTNARRATLTGRVEWRANRWLRLGGYASVNTRAGAGDGPIRDYSAVQTGIRASLAI